MSYTQLITIIFLAEKSNATEPRMATGQRRRRRVVSLQLRFGSLCVRVGYTTSASAFTSALAMTSRFRYRNLTKHSFARRLTAETATETETETETVTATATAGSTDSFTILCSRRSAGGVGLLRREQASKRGHEARE